MRPCPSVLVCCLVVALAMGCNNGSPTAGQPDAWAAGDAVYERGDASAVTDKLALAAVLDRMILPTTSDSYAFDYDGKGEKNKLEALYAALGLAQLPDLQTEVDNQVSRGEFILLFRVFADDLASDAESWLRLDTGTDQDGDPTDNFGGSEPLAIDAASPAVSPLRGTIEGSKLAAGPGRAFVPLPFGPLGPVMLQMEQVRVEAALESGTSGVVQMTGGRITGAVPQSEIDGKLIPTLADLLTYFWLYLPVSKLADQAAAIDANNNGKIDDSEVTSHALIGPLVRPDVDLDGDGKPDAIAIGYGFTATQCVILEAD